LAGVALSNVTDVGVIMDSMISICTLLRAAALPGGQAAWASDALAHASAVARGHFRPDGSTFHLVIFDKTTGAVIAQVSGLR
jgi:hypothetical protein